MNIQRFVLTIEVIETTTITVVQLGGANDDDQDFAPAGHAPDFIDQRNAWRSNAQPPAQLNPTDQSTGD
jgi:hypothetical protein